MKHLGVLLTICLVVASGFTAVGATGSHRASLTEQRTACFSTPILTLDNDQTSLQMDGTNAYVDTPGLPLIPSYQTRVVLPFGTHIQSISVVYSQPISYTLSQPLVLATAPVPLNEPIIAQKTESMVAPACYPEESYLASTGAGLNGATEASFLTLICYPCRYYSQDQTLTVSSQVTITITYQTPTTPITFGDEKDLLIIAPEKFSDALAPLVDHKETKGMRTILMTVEDILASYDGYDAPEQIKYAIKDMKETLGIRYVLLVGGLDSLIKAVARDDVNQGTKDWYVPVRYSNLCEGGATADHGFLCDLYYADIYDSEGNFSSWDSNGNHIYAEWYGAKDIFDLYPDVFVGRLACANLKEVKTVVNKIITYESTPATQKPWFSTMIAIGGDTFDDVNGYNYYEGEVETGHALTYMTNFTPVKIWASNRNTTGLVPVPKDIVKTISAGSGFVYFSGHGSPERWNCYWPGAFDEERARGIWYINLPFLHNQEKLPVIVVGGCHNSEFNITMTSFLHKPAWVYNPTPECFSWLLVRNPRGGAIATFGNTGIGYGEIGNAGDRDGDGVDDPDCVEARGGYLENLFFKAYGVNDSHVLGDAWGYAISHYIDTYPGMVTNQILDIKTVEQWAMLGDPSLMIGGY